MLKIYTKIIIFFVILSCTQLQAQMYDNIGGMGLDRSIGSSHRANKPRKTEPVDYVKKAVENMTEKLNLDGFQSAIVKNIMEEYQKNTTTISEENIPNEAKFEKIKIERNKMDAQIIEILNDNQKIIFAELGKKNTEGKHKKKQKRNSEE